MVTTALYEIETSEADDGTTFPAAGIWAPSSEDAADNGFITYGGLYVAGIGAPNDDRPHPDRFVALGHQRGRTPGASSGHRPPSPAPSRSQPCATPPPRSRHWPPQP